MVMVKICGITRVEDLESTVKAGADFIGFVVNVPSSPRNIDINEATCLLSSLPSSVKSVIVTVPKSLKDLDKIMKLNPDYIQLHGETYLLMRSAEKVPKEKTIGVVNAKLPNALDIAVKYSELFGIVLLDSLKDSWLGGSGEPHDWRLSKIIRDRLYPKPIILAGGLTPENVADAVNIVKPYGVDVSTGVEAKPGVKDPEKVSKFIRRAKEAGI